MLPCGRSGWPCSSQPSSSSPPFAPPSNAPPTSSTSPSLPLSLLVLVLVGPSPRQIQLLDDGVVAGAAHGRSRRLLLCFARLPHSYVAASRLSVPLPLLLLFLTRRREVISLALAEIRFDFYSRSLSPCPNPVSPRQLV